MFSKMYDILLEIFATKITRKCNYISYNQKKIEDWICIQFEYDYISWKLSRVRGTETWARKCTRCVYGKSH